jgi:hypothetical protein
MRDYIKLMLGAPENNCEISDSGINQIIEDCCQIYTEFNDGGGSYQDAIIFNTVAGQDEYPTSAITAHGTSATFDDIQSVYNFEAVNITDGINTLFAPAHMLLFDDFVRDGNYPGGPGQNRRSNDGLVMTSYVSAMSYIKEIGMFFNKEFQVKYIQGKEVLKLIPTPMQVYTGVLVVNRRLADAQIYNNYIVKQMCVGKAKMRQGATLGKYTGNLPDGLSINAQQIYDNGKAEYDAAYELCWKTANPPGFIVG